MWRLVRSTFGAKESVVIYLKNCFLYRIKMQAFLKSNKLETEKTQSPSTSKTKKQPRNAPWVEKYRPKTIYDVVEQTEAIAVLKECLSGAEFPNLLFYGPPGTGKTSTILAAARQLFGDTFRDRILELNASDERGIYIIRDKVRVFAELAAGGTRPDGKPCPPFKIIILDEADAMTFAAQAALRRTMEKESKTTRFCLICNYISRIIEPLASRSTKFRFKPLKKEKILERLEYICSQEKITSEPAALHSLIEASGGDMRKAITFLQSCSRLVGKECPITEADVLDVTAVILPKYLEEFLKLCKAKDYNKMDTFVQKMMMEANAAGQFMLQFNKYLVETDEFNDMQKAVIGEKLGRDCYMLQMGCSEYILLLDLASSIIEAHTMH